MSTEHYIGYAYLGNTPAFSGRNQEHQRQVDQIDARFGRKIIGFARGILGTLAGETWKFDASKGFPVLKERPVNPWSPVVSIDTALPCGLMLADLEDSQLPLHMTDKPVTAPSAAFRSGEIATKAVSRVVHMSPVSKTA